MKFFDNIVAFVTGNWKKLAVTVGVAVAAFFGLAFLLPILLSSKVIVAGIAVAAGYLFYISVAYWEIQAAAAKLGVKL